MDIKDEKSQFQMTHKYAEDVYLEIVIFLIENILIEEVVILRKRIHFNTCFF